MNKEISLVREFLLDQIEVPPGIPDYSKDIIREHRQQLIPMIPLHSPPVSNETLEQRSKSIRIENSTSFTKKTEIGIDQKSFAEEAIPQKKVLAKKKLKPTAYGRGLGRHQRTKTDEHL